jgi:hypothetical protein
MGKAAGGAAAEHEPDGWAAAFDGDVAGIHRFIRNVDARHGNPRQFKAS